jgi:hypothetical protein
MICGLPEGSLKEFTEKTMKMESLSCEFREFAATVARVIVAELPLPDCERTIPLSSLPGLAGGAKYICHGAIFKVATAMSDPTRAIYGDEENAAKAGANEVRAAAALDALHIFQLRVPLQCAVDVLGHRVIVCALAPIDRVHGIVAGSDGRWTARVRHTTGRD